MGSTPSRPSPARSISREEIQDQPGENSATEQTPLIAPVQQAKHEHRFLGIPLPLWLPRRYVAAALAFLITMVILLCSALFVDPIWRRKQNVFMNNGTHDFRKTVVVISFDGFR